MEFAGVLVKTIITDYDKALTAAIAEVLLSTKHQLCASHLQKDY